MLVGLLFAASLAVAPADRLAMADRLFNRGDYTAARVEYLALRGVDGVAADEIDFRLVSSANALGETNAVRTAGAAFLTAHPTSEHADRVRLISALAAPAEARITALRQLDREDVAPDLRAEALFRLAELTNDAELFNRAFRADPKGRFAGVARFRHAYSLIANDDPALRRQGDTELMELVYGKDAALARQALYLVAVHSYRENRFSESATLLRRFRKLYPDDARMKEVTRLLAASELMNGNFAVARALADDESDGGLLYVKALAVARLGETDLARQLAEKYLNDFPAGESRAGAELLLAQDELERAIAGKDTRRILAAATRCAALAKSGAERLRVGWAYEQAGESERAEQEYATIARDFPGGAVAADALDRRAMSLLRRGQWGAAEVSLAEALATGRLTAERAALAFYWRGVAANQLGHVEESVGFLREALSRTLPLDERREARLIIADADFNAGRREEAVKAYAELVREGAVKRMSAAKTLAVGKVLTGDEARTCARQLQENAAPEWRQAGYALQSDIETAAGNLTAAAYADRKCLEEPCETEVAATSALRLGLYLVREGDAMEAEKALKRAVDLLSTDPTRRAAAYLGLAEAARLRGDEEQAKGYATVVVTLFEQTPSAAAARNFLK